MDSARTLRPTLTPPSYFRYTVFKFNFMQFSGMCPYRHSVSALSIFSVLAIARAEMAVARAETGSINCPENINKI